jgi:hypothetical protein
MATALRFVVTCGIYSIYWYVDTSRRLNRLQGSRISSWFMGFFVGLALASSSLVLTSAFAPGTVWVDEGATFAPYVLGFAWLWWTFRLRAALEHVSGGRFARSWLWAFLFEMFYLQTQINRLVERVRQPLVPHACVEEEGQRA